MDDQLALTTNPRGVIVYYDGDCPVCRSYVQRVRLKHSAGLVSLVNLREHPLDRQTLEREGYKLDAGMVVVVGGQGYHGAEAVNVLALLSSRSGWLNRLNYHVFRSHRISKALYPILVAGRRLLLFLLGRKPLSHDGSHTPDGANELRKTS